MKRAPKFLQAALALVVAAGVVAGCSMPGQKKEEPTPKTETPPAASNQEQKSGPATGGVWRQYFTNPTSMDPHIWTWGSHIARMGVFEGLFRYDQEMKAIPAAAEKAEVAADNVTWTITLKSGLKWSNGEPLTARDFEYSLKRVMDPKTWEGASSAYQNNVGILNAVDFRNGKITDASQVGVKATNETTLVITLEKPNPDLPLRLAEPFGLPVHKATVDKFGKDWAKPGNIVSNGPFVLKSWTPNSEMVLERNANYAGRFPAKLDQVKLLFTQDANAANTMLAYQNSELEFMSVTPTDIDRVKSDPVMSKELHTVDTGVYKALVVLNSKDDLLLNNKKLRMAFAMAIDKKKLAEKVSKGTVTPLDTLIPSLVGDWGNSLEALPFDPVKAKQLLAEAGYPEGKGLPKLNLVISHGANIDPFILGVIDEWKTHLGVEVNLDNMEYGLAVQKMTQVTEADYMGFYDNAWVSSYKSQDLYATGGLFNPVHLLPGAKLDEYRAIAADKEKSADQKAQEQQAILDQFLPAEAKQLDELIKKAEQTLDRNEQIALRKQAAQVREQMHFAIPLYTWKRFNLVKGQFKGVQFNPFLNGLPLYWDPIYLDK